jgi:hypothetical protein
LLLALAAPFSGSAAQFVEVTAELQISDWDYHFFVDRKPDRPDDAAVPSVFTASNTRRCVIGVDRWMIESVFPDFTETSWFTGTNILTHTVVTRKTSDELAAKISERTGLAAGSPEAGHRFTRVHESADGNPGRPGGVADVLGFNLPSKIAWLAFCSAPTLRHEPRRLYPSSDLWKESNIYYSGWTDSTVAFKDGLGLPRSMDLVSTNGQPIFQYQVGQSTNLLGWRIPLEFYGVQYLPTRTNGWKLHLTFKGKVTSIAPAHPMEIPPEIMKVIEK